MNANNLRQVKAVAAQLVSGGQARPRGEDSEWDVAFEDKISICYFARANVYSNTNGSIVRRTLVSNCCIARAMTGSGLGCVRTQTCCGAVE